MKKGARYTLRIMETQCVNQPHGHSASWGITHACEAFEQFGPGQSVGRDLHPVPSAALGRVERVIDELDEIERRLVSRLHLPHPEAYRHIDARAVEGEIG